MGYEQSVSEVRGISSSLRVSFDTLGCRSNYAATVELQAALLERGPIIPCLLGPNTDVYVINSCTITDAADREVVKLLRRARRQAPHAKIVITGCMASSKERVYSLEDADFVIPPNDRERLISAILGEDELSRSGKEACDVTRSLVESCDVSRSRVELSHPISAQISGPGDRTGELRNRARYHLRIQDGCNKCCTYCIIPKVKTDLVSRPIDRVLADLNYLSRVGYQEVVLTGTHLGLYSDGSSKFLDLLRILAEKTPIPRIRVSSLDPNEVTKETVEIIAQSDIFCNHFHICIQSFCDGVLRRMNRHYRMADVAEILWYIVEKMPGCCIGSDLITGFPGESRQEVDEGLNEFLRLPISYLHVFPYSERQGTAAPKMAGSVELTERRERAARFREAGEKKRAEYFSRLVGRNVEAIVEKLDRSFAYGTSREYAFLKISRYHSSGELRQDLSIGAKVTAIVNAVDVRSRKLLCQ